jgi:hypothetical protein
MPEHDRPGIAPLPDMLKRSAEAYDISTESLDVDVLLAGEAARHFPEPRSRRKEDAEEDDIQRLRAILEALDRGSEYPDEDLGDITPPVLSQFYKQF